jgi:ABC-type arginine transport system permease subunit
MGGCAAQAWRAASPQLRAEWTAKLEKTALASVAGIVRYKTQQIRPHFLKDAFFPG